MTLLLSFTDALQCGHWPHWSERFQQDGDSSHLMKVLVAILSRYVLIVWHSVTRGFVMWSPHCWSACFSACRAVKRELRDRETLPKWNYLQINNGSLSMISLLYYTDALQCGHWLYTLSWETKELQQDGQWCAQHLLIIYFLVSCRDAVCGGLSESFN